MSVSRFNFEFISFYVAGKPAPGGSKKAFKSATTKKIVVIDAAKGNRAWRNAVQMAARQAMKKPFAFAHLCPLAGIPIEMRAEFYLPRPKAHFAASGKMKSSAPLYPIVRPDTTKLLRSTEDALTGVLWKDDAQIVFQTAIKEYAVGDNWEGACMIRIFVGGTLTHCEGCKSNVIVFGKSDCPNCKKPVEWDDQYGEFRADKYSKEQYQP